MIEEKWQLGEAIRSARIRKGLTQEALAELLDFSVDALVFPGRESGETIHTTGLTAEEREAVERLVDVMRRRK